MRAIAPRIGAPERLSLQPLNLRDANALVTKWHRHNPAVRGAKFCLGALAGGLIVGCAIAGRPIARAFDDGWTLEVTRCATDGTANACSFLYGATRRVGQAMGYRRIITYSRTDEGGASLRGAGWRKVAEIQPRSWAKSSIARPRIDTTEPAPRWLWEWAA